jgi:hypothetical protein
MLKYIEPKLFSVVLVPDYLVTTLAAKGMTLQEIDMHRGVGFNINTSGSNTNFNILNRDKQNNAINLRDWLIKNISKNDLIDLVAANEFFIRYLLPIDKSTILKPSQNLYGVDKLIKNELLDTDQCTQGYDLIDSRVHELIYHYRNKNIDLQNIIMSRDKNTVDTVWTTVVCDNTLFVIMHSGFTEFVDSINIQYQYYFVERIIDCLFKEFGEHAVINSMYFKSFIRLSLIKRNCNYEKECFETTY